MIALEDCIALCGLTLDEIDAIAEHEHIPELAAAALGDYLMHSDEGMGVVRDMIADDVRDALAKGHPAHARQLVAALSHFLDQHPEAAPAPAPAIEAMAATA